MKIIYFIALLFISISFSSFASENNSTNSIHNTTIHAVPPKNLKITTTKKQNKINFKEKLALKLVEKKIKEAQKKQTKTIKSKKGEGGIAAAILISILLILGGLIGGIIYLALGEILLGSLLLVGGLIVVPIILVLIVLSHMVIC